MIVSILLPYNILSGKFSILNSVDSAKSLLMVSLKLNKIECNYWLRATRAPIFYFYFSMSLQIHFSGLYSSLILALPLSIELCASRGRGRRRKG
jgi:hypothetical protein